ncbi:MAG: hypothetical protein WBQ48_10655, partial [Aeromicrobium sp.]
LEVDPAELEAVGRGSDGVEPVAGRLELDRAHRWVKELSGAAAVHAMIAATTRASTLTVLGAAGWHVVTYTPQSDIPVMWSDLDRARTRAAG